MRSYDEIRKWVVNGNSPMSKHGEGAWLETAARFSEGLPEGPARRSVLLERCKREGSDEKLISRMISARAYALRWMDEEDIRAAHKTVEMLRTLDNLNAAKAAFVRNDVLKGVMSRPELTLILDDEKVENQARKVEVLSITYEEVIAQCRAELDIIDHFLWIKPPIDEKGEILGANAEYYSNDFDEKRREIIYEHKWALVVSPHISCSKIFGSGTKGFILSIAALSWSYSVVSVFCSSEHEKSQIMKIINRNMEELIVREKLSFHVATSR